MSDPLTMVGQTWVRNHDGMRGLIVAPTIPGVTGWVSAAGDTTHCGADYLTRNYTQAHETRADQ